MHVWNFTGWDGELQLIKKVDEKAEDRGRERNLLLQTVSLLLSPHGDNHQYKLNTNHHQIFETHTVFVYR